MKNIILLTLATIVLMTLSSCKEKSYIEPLPVLSEQGIFIVSEGNFTFGNGSLSYLDLEQNKVYNQVFYNQNGFPLGDVPQSVFQKGDTLFVVVNNSGKIVLMDSNDFKYITTIEGFVSPRQILQTKDHLAYVSDLYSNNLTILDLETLEKKGSIDLGYSSESMILHEDYAYIANWSYGQSLFKVDINNNQIISSIDVGVQPNSLVLDKNDRLWVLCDGGFEGSPHAWDYASLYQIDLSSFTVLKSIRFEHKDYNPKTLKINTAKDTLFFISAAYGGQSSVSSGIFKMSIEDTFIPTEPFIHERGGYFYNFGISPLNQDIYVSDVLDYIRAGWLWKFDKNGMLQDSFRVDIIPGELIFKTK